MTIILDLNGCTVSVRSPDDTPLLWVIRDEIGLTGTKFGRNIGMCGAYTVHVDGRAARSCITTIGTVAGAKITTIEALIPMDSTRCSGPGSICRFRNAATVSRARSCRRPCC